MNFTSRSIARSLCILSFAFLICFAPQLAPVALATQLDIAGPAGSGAFGTSVTVLPGGNIVIADPFYDITTPSTIADVGAVYLYNGSGAFINALTGSRANDRIGNFGVTLLTNGNYVVVSVNWNGTRGAVTWCSGTTGCAGAVSPSNSLVGSRGSDLVGSRGVAALTNGNYVVSSPSLGQRGDHRCRGNHARRRRDRRRGPHYRR